MHGLFIAHILFHLYVFSLFKQ